MEVLIDAYNVMFAHPQLGPLIRRDNEAARREFLAYVSRNRPAGARRVHVVFDAHRDPAPPTTPGRTRSAYESGLHVVFATETADVWIQSRIRNASDPGQITVVTSDREILATAAAHGAGILRVSTFLKLQRRRSSRARADKPSHMSKRELQRWEKLFRERDDEDND